MLVDVLFTAKQAVDFLRGDDAQARAAFTEFIVG